MFILLLLFQHVRRDKKNRLTEESGGFPDRLPH